MHCGNPPPGRIVVTAYDGGGGVSDGKMGDMVDMYSSFDHVWQCTNVWDG